MMFDILCNGNKIGQRHTEGEAQRFADERKAKYPNSHYQVVPHVADGHEQRRQVEDYYD